jgi:micrococcal nuclease
MRTLWLTLAILTAVAQPAHSAPTALLARASSAGQTLEAKVTDNHDGDTLTLRLDNGQVEKVRLLGIDTAEIAQGEWGARARDFMRSLVANQRVKVVFDVEQRDRYGRLLGYVYLPNGTFVNLEMVRQGYAMVLTYPPNVAHTDEFVAAQKEAQSKKLNIWSANGLAESPRDFRRRGATGGYTRGEGMRVASPKPTARVPAKAGQVIMNMNSKKYHTPDCKNADCKNCQAMSEAEAKAKGGVPAKDCH